jgi:hypothetical protein
MALDLSYVVDVSVVVSNPGVTEAGFGTPMIVSHTAAWAERTRTYTSMDGVVLDFAATTPEWAAAAAVFAQEPRPPQLLIGRAAVAPIMIRQLAIAIVQLGQAYSVNAWRTAVLQVATYTAVASVAWVALTVYTTGFLVTNDTGKLYLCITAGTAAGSGGPTGTAADITDGTVHWMYAGAGSTGVTCNDAIAYGIMKALNALAVPDIGATSTLSGSVGSKVVLVTGDAGATWFDVEPIGTDPSALCDLMTCTETTLNSGSGADGNIQTALAALYNASSAWYGLILLFKSSAILQAANTWSVAQTNQKLLIASSEDTEIATVADGSATDVAHVLKGVNSKYTQVFFHPRGYEFADAAELGRWLPIPPGSDNWRLKTLAGVTAFNYTATQVVNMEAKNAAYYTLFGGQSVVAGQGRCAGGQPVDVTRSIDQMKAWYQQDIANLLLQNEKIPYTDPGAAQVEAVIRGVNARGIGAGIVNPGGAGIPAPTVTIPLVSSQTTGDRNLRKFSGLKTGWRLAGALNKVAVAVAITA